MKFRAADIDIEVREGTAEDIPMLLSFIRSMAEFEKLAVTATEEILRKNLFADRPAAYTLFAFANGTPVAYAVYFFTFSTMVGKRGLWLDDLYVTPDYRGKGIARSLMAYLAELASENRCGRFEWMVLDWNKPAIEFYKRLGATIHDDWRICRLEEDQFAHVAKHLARMDGNG